MSGAAKYRSIVENLDTQYCYLKANYSDKLFNPFVSNRTDEKDSINFVIVKQVGETASGQVYELKTNCDESNSNDEERQLRHQQGQGVSSTRNARLQFKSIRTRPGFILAERNNSRAAKRNASTKEKKGRSKRVRIQLGELSKHRQGIFTK